MHPLAVAAAHPAPLIVFLLIFARISATLVAAPIFSEPSLPVPVKIGLSALLAGMLTPDQIPLTHAISADPTSFVILMGQQIVLGLAYALVFTVVYRAAESAGELIGQQMGVTLAGWHPTGSDGEIHSIAQLYHIIAGLIFLGLDGPHWILLTLGASLNIMPVTAVTLSPALLKLLLPLGGSAIAFALSLALPLLATLLLADLVTGLLGRAMPSLNMFVLGLPLKVGLSIVALLIAAPFTISLMSGLMRQLAHLALGN